MAKLSVPSTIGGKAVGRTGFGLMGLTTRPYAPVDYPTAVKVMKEALNRGANFWNGGLNYGSPTANSIHLIKYYFDQYPEDADKVFLSIKGAYSFATHTASCSPEALKAEIDEALKVLDGVKKIDLYQCARVDPKVPVEISIGALGELVAAGKIGSIGLSEVNENTIRRAQAVHPIAAVEVELSIFTPDILTNGIAATCREFGIPIVAYGPLGSGFLTGKIKRPEDLPEGSWLRSMPRFQSPAFEENLKLVKAIQAIAEKKGATSGQVAIAWVRAQGTLPIPGATSVERVTENSTEFVLGEDEMGQIQKIMDSMPVAGARYPEQLMQLTNL